MSAFNFSNEKDQKGLHAQILIPVVIGLPDFKILPLFVIKIQVQAPARAGAVAPMDVKVPAQQTTLGPEKTSFFQALSIPTKITKGTIEILVSLMLLL